MKSRLLLLFIIFTAFKTNGQVKIHAHNDYEKPKPLTNALANQAFSIEADIFLQNSKLLVAHSKNQISKDKTLDALYIKPIVSLFRKYKKQVSGDSSYQFSLMIDIKEGGAAAIRQLIKSVQPYKYYFDRQLNSKAVQLIISGDRGNINEWKKYPRYILFDGRPNEKYDDQTINKIAVISDAYSSYSENKEKLKSVLEYAHQMGKPFRFWGTPDNEFSWKFFMDAGVDIINTDKPEACRIFVTSQKNAD